MLIRAPCGLPIGSAGILGVCVRKCRKKVTETYNRSVNNKQVVRIKYFGILIHDLHDTVGTDPVI